MASLSSLNSPDSGADIPASRRPGPAPDGAASPDAARPGTAPSEDAPRPRCTAKSPDRETPLPAPLVRAATPGDAAALLAIYAPYVRDTAVSFEYDVPSEREFARRIAGTLESHPYLVAERDGRPAGYAYVSPFKERVAYSWSVETSIYVDRDMRRGGVGRALYLALEESLRAMGILNANACIAMPAEVGAGRAAEPDEHLTDDSERFHERMGYWLVGRFHQCGYKFGRWYDMIWMEKMLGEHRAGQAAVRPFGDILPELRAAGVLA